MAAPTGPSIGALRGAVDLAPLVNRPPARPAATGAPGEPPEPAEAAADGGIVFDAGDADFGRVVELSSTVPVVVALVAPWSTPAKELVASLTRLVTSAAGRLVLAVVDADANPQLASAFQAQAIPTVAAVIAGRPLALFSGSAPEDQIAALLSQVLEIAVEQGVTGSVAAPGQPVPAEPAEAPLPPHHAEAYDAIERGDYVEAAQHFRTAIAQDPRDAAAVAALAQVELLERVRTMDAAAVRASAAASPTDAEAGLAVADIDVAGGHIDDAFNRLLTLFGALRGADRDPVRQRLLAYFEIVGADDPRVVAARRRLTMLLY